MTEISVTAMSLSEKLYLMERLWAFLESDPGYVPPTWHGEVLERRTAELASGETETLTLEQLDEELNSFDA